VSCTAAAVVAVQAACALRRTCCSRSCRFCRRAGGGIDARRGRPSAGQVLGLPSRTYDPGNAWGRPSTNEDDSWARAATSPAAISFLTTTDEEVNLVHSKLNWESAQLAELIADKSRWRLPVRMIGQTIWKQRFGTIVWKPRCEDRRAL
jgi:hypothetical protein